MIKYILYYSIKENSYYFFEETNQDILRELPNDIESIWETESSLREIAYLKRNEYLGWEPYKPKIQNNNDLFKFLPENKFDVDKAKILINIGYPLIKPILFNLFEWMQDFNCPIAKVICPFLASLGFTCNDEIQIIFNSNDSVWKYWVLEQVIEKMKLEEIIKYEPILSYLDRNLSRDDKLEEVDMALRSVFKKINHHI